MNTYKISATSNILETNKCWETLKKTFSLKFLNYGDLVSGLFSKNDHGLIIIIFLEDLLQNIKSDYNTLKNNQENFFRLIKERAKNSSEPIIICFGSNQSQSVIELVKSDTNEKIFYEWFLQELKNIRDTSNVVYLLNINDIFYQYGARKMFSERNWYYSRCRLSLEGLEIFTDNLIKIINRIVNPAKKVLVLDCDNTIWGGVVGEDGIEGLVLGQDGLGQAFVDFQKEIVNLVEKGLIVVLSSKNNENDVWDVFDNHGSMILKRDHIVMAKINWDEKANNILEISKDLDLNIDSFVFWDDNPLERDKMRKLVPNVVTIEIPKNVFEWHRFLRNLDFFSKFKVLYEDKNKTEQYRSRAVFNSGVRTTKDIKAYLSSLNLLPVLLPISNTNIARAEQLCQKTNQFNLSVKRHSASGLLIMDKDPNYNIFLVNFSDLYGDHGIIALVCLSNVIKDFVYLDTFLMSCRILGRHLEAWILNQVKEYALDQGKKMIVADFYDTGKNKIAKDFLKIYGFKKVTESSTTALSIKKANLSFKGRGYFLQLTGNEIPNIDIYSSD
jgi:FkbH-like protein